MSFFSRIFPQNNSADEEVYQPLDDKRMARLRWALDFELGMMGDGPNSDPHPRPLIMGRQPRNRDGSWPSQNSWIGGLPRLGDADWPKDEAGSPLPFVAQISMSDLASYCPESPLPEDGWLAFFLGDSGMPPELRVYHDEERHSAIREAQLKLIHLMMEPRQSIFSVGDMRRSGACKFDTNYWQGPVLLSQMFAQALQSLQSSLTQQEEWLKSAREELAELQKSEYRDNERIAEVEHGIIETETDLPWQQSNCEAFEAFCASFADIVKDQKPWDMMGAKDFEAVLDRLGEAHGRFDQLLLPGTPCNLDEMQDMVLRKLLTGTIDDFDRMPSDVLERVNADFRLTLGQQHHVFGLGYGHPKGFEEGEDNLMLFQMAPDDMLETDLHGVDAWQFWISRDDASEGKWDDVKLVVRAN